MRRPVAPSCQDELGCRVRVPAVLFLFSKFQTSMIETDMEVDWPVAAVHVICWVSTTDLSLGLTLGCLEHERS